MTKRQKLKAKARKLAREKRDLATTVATIALAAEPTDEQRTESRAAQQRVIEINGEINEVETALDGLPADDVREHRAEDTEFARLVRGASIGAIFGAAIEHRATTGATAELQQHFKMGGNMVPLAMLRSTGAEHRPASGEAEHRAVTPAPTNAGATADVPGIPLFVGGLADYFGIPQPIVPVGEAVYNVLTSRPTVHGPYTDSTDAGDTTGTWSSDALKPKRMQASFIYRSSDAAAINGMDEALRLALTAALSEANDQEIVDQIVSDVARTDAGAADTYAKVADRFAYAMVDGRHAQQESDVRLLVGTATLADWGALSDTGRSAVQNVRSIVGGLRVSPLVAAAAGNKQDVIVRRGLARDAVAPVWDGVEIIVDNVTGSGKGEIEITARVHSDRKVIRAAGFARIQAQHA